MISIVSKTFLVALVATLSFTMKPSEGQFITTTPCHDDLRKLHNIPAGVDCSVINWDLKLSEDNGKQTFTLKSTWGFFVDNWTTEKRGSAESSGTWKEQRVDNTDRVILTTSNGLSASFRKLDLNHLHVLDAKGNLAKGNDGYSFTLNNAKSSAQAQQNVIAKEITTSTESFTKTIFAGRTPCQEIARESNAKVDASCFKLKWKITFYQDSITHLPTRYEMNRIFHQVAAVKGSWKIFSATINGRKEVLYQLDPDKPETSITFMKGDDNVLFFLDKKLNFLAGSNEFGYTLNRR